MLINTMELVFHRAPGKRLPQSDSPPPLHQLRPHLHHLPSAQAFAVDGAEGLGHQAFDVLAHHVHRKAQAFGIGVPVVAAKAALRQFRIGQSTQEADGALQRDAR